MSSSTPELTAAVLTVSDSSSRGEREDLGGPAVAAALEKRGFRIVAREIVPDDEPAITDAIKRLCAQARFVVTTGGTGVAPRDVTPEATRAVCDRLLGQHPGAADADAANRPDSAAHAGAGDAAHSEIALEVVLEFGGRACLAHFL